MRVAAASGCPSLGQGQGTGLDLRDGCCSQVVDRLRAVGVPAWSNPGSVCVVLPPEMLSHATAAKFGVVFGGGLAHIYVMDSVTDDVLEAFVADLACAASGRDGA